MAEQEGIIKYTLAHQITPPPMLEQVAELIAWRKILYQLNLIGEDPHRYGGYGFGNLSRSLAPVGAPATQRTFIISGTQTGALADLGPEHFATVTECVPEGNRVVSRGPIQPSSEAMTHATLYALDAQVRAVMHVHSPHIWRAAERLGLPATPANVPYGTVAMAEAVRDLLSRSDTRRLHLLVMGGHEDGVVVFGKSLTQSGTALLTALAEAYRAI